MADKRSRSGVTLIELMISVALVATVVISASLVISKAFKSDFDSRYRSAATRVATAKMLEIQALPYALVPLTSTGSWFTSSADPGGCDCTNGTNYSLLPDWATVWVGTTTPAGDTVITDKIAFHRQVCINQVDRVAGSTTFNAHCPPSLDCPIACLESNLLPFHGKNVQVQVSWIVSGDTKTVKMETLAVR
jgi:prepilin-type N-terminal cleavage/methylation domain-containing protein